MELMATVLQHPEGVDAPAPGMPAAGGADASGGGGGGSRHAAEEPALGAAPHMIRGQLTGFSQARAGWSGAAVWQCTR